MLVLVVLKLTVRVTRRPWNTASIAVSLSVSDKACMCIFRDMRGFWCASDMLRRDHKRKIRWSKQEFCVLLFRLSYSTFIASCYAHGIGFVRTNMKEHSRMQLLYSDKYHWFGSKASSGSMVKWFYPWYVSSALSPSSELDVMSSSTFLNW